MKDGTLLVGPKYLLGQEISHAAITNGGDVIAAGEAEISAAAGLRFASRITNQSGHYLPGPATLAISAQAFKNIGVQVAEGVLEVFK